MLPINKQVLQCSQRWHNRFVRSEDFSSGAWTKTDTTVVADASIDPLGGTTADKIVEAATSAEHYVSQAPTLVAGYRYTFSAYLLAGERTWGMMDFRYSGGAANRVYFNLVNGVVGSTIAGTTIFKSITAEANGFYRCAVGIHSESAAAAVCRIYSITADNTLSHLGIITMGIYAWGAQVTQGLGVKPYFPIVATAKF